MFSHPPPASGRLHEQARNRNDARQPEHDRRHASAEIQDAFDSWVECSVNHHARVSKHAWNADNNDPVHELMNLLSITGLSTYPEDRSGDVYEVTFGGNNAIRGRGHSG